MAAPPSLLADENGDDAPPSLSCGTGMLMEESPLLERLSQMPPQHQQHQELSLALDGSNQLPYSSLSMRGQFSNHEQRNESPNSSSIATVIAGSLSVLLFGFTWGSYLAESWFDTYLKVASDWQEKYLPALDGLVSTKIQATNIASILGTLNSAGQHATFLVLLLTALVIPCLCMMLCPTWTLSDHKERFQGRSRGELEFRAPRILFEWMARSALVAVYVLLIIDIGTSSISFELNGAYLFVYNKSREGLVAYTLGIFCALGAIVVLRAARVINDNKRNQYTSDDVSESMSTPRAPPAQAFQLPWTSPRQTFDMEEITEPLLTDDLGDGIEDATQRASNTRRRRWSSFSSRCYGFVTYQLGLVAIVTWIPAMFLPLLEISYTGLASEFMTEVSLVVRLWEFPALVWARGLSAGSDKYMLVVIGFILLLTVYILPLLALFLACTIRLMELAKTKMYQGVLLCIHPLLGAIVFAASVLAGATGFEPVAEYLLDEKTSGFCKQFEFATDESCLTIRGHPLVGAWLFLVHAVALEFLVVLVVWNSSRRRH